MPYQLIQNQNKQKSLIIYANNKFQILSKIEKKRKWPSEEPYRSERQQSMPAQRQPDPCLLHHCQNTIPCSNRRYSCATVACCSQWMMYGAGRAEKCRSRRRQLWRQQFWRQQFWRQLFWRQPPGLRSAQRGSLRVFCL